LAIEMKEVFANLKDIKISILVMRAELRVNNFDEISHGRK